MLKKKKEQKALAGGRRWLYDRQVRKAKRMVTDKKAISDKIRSARKIIERLQNIPRCKGLTQNICTFCDLLSDYFDGAYPNLPLSTIIAVLAGLLYLILPTDILADFLPILGWFDDAGVMAFVVATETNDVKEYISWKERQALEESTIVDEAE